MRPRTHQRTYCPRRIPGKDMQTVVQQGRNDREIGKYANVETKTKENSIRQRGNHQTKPHSIIFSMGLN